MSYACDMSALTPVQRKRHRELTRELTAAMTGRDELANGFAFHVQSPVVEEWISLESRCCPFLEFDYDGRVLRLTGGEGVKAFILAEMNL